METIGITGGTGFIGRHVTQLLTDKGYNIIILTREPEKYKNTQNIQFIKWEAEKKQGDTRALQNISAMIHLAGAGIADKRWTEKRKQDILKSRTEGTHYLISQLQQHAPKCKNFIAASAIGFYGPDRKGVIPFTEDALPHNDFLGNTCLLWEQESKKAADTMRTVILRFGIVLGKESGAFPKFAMPLKFGVMPILGSGRQVISWITVQDLSKMIVYCLDQQQLSGIYNAIAPQPVTNKQLMKTIAAIKGGIKIPIPVPAFALKITLGEMSEEVLKSCTVSDAKIQEAGFQFQHTDITMAVRALLGK